MDIRDLTKQEADELHKEWERLKKPTPDNKRKFKKDEGGYIDPELLIPWWYLYIPSVGCAELDCDGDGESDYNPVKPDLNMCTNEEQYP